MAGGKGGGPGADGIPAAGKGGGPGGEGITAGGRGGGPGGDGIPASGKGGGPGGEDAVHTPFDVTPLIQPGLGVLALVCLCLVVLLLVRCCCRGRRTVELPADHPYHALPARALTPKKPTKQEEEDFDLFEGAEEKEGGGGGLRPLRGGRRHS